MTDVRFDRADIQTVFALALFAEHFCNGGYLRRITCCRSALVTVSPAIDPLTGLSTRSMCLDIDSVTRVEASTGIHTSHKIGLGHGVRERNSRCLAILVQSGISDESMNVVAVTDSIIKTLEDETDDAFATSVAGTTAIKDVTLPIRIGHAIEK